MTDPTQSERGTEQPSEGLPIPNLESPSSDSSPSSVDTDAIVKQVTENLRRELRMAQSNKDKELAAIKKTLGISDLSELEAMGAQIPDNVKLEYRLRQIESGRSPESSPVTPAPSPGNGAALTAQEVSEVVKQYQLDANDASVIDALRGTYRNRDHFEVTMARLSLARTNRPAPDAANAPSAPSRSSASPDKAAEIERGYLEAVAKVPRGNIYAMDKVKREWRKKAREAGLQLNV